MLYLFNIIKCRTTLTHDWSVDLSICKFYFSLTVEIQIFLWYNIDFKQDDINKYIISMCLFVFIYNVRCNFIFTGLYLLTWFIWQETILQYSFSEVLSTRQYRNESNQHYLDMKLGNLMVQKIVRIETDQVWT